MGLSHGFVNEDKNMKTHIAANMESNKMCGAAETHNFDSTDNIKLIKLKFRPIIDETGTYKAAKVISPNKTIMLQ